MISFITGKVLVKTESFIILEKNGIGFKVFLSGKNLKKIKEKDSIDVFTHLCIRNEKPELYGFSEIDQLRVFELLEKISGIGPKAALVIAALGGLKDLEEAVKAQDFKYFQNIKGVGTKKIQKIILEIGGELRRAECLSTPKRDGAEQALTSLGFSLKEAKEALRQVPAEISDVEERIKKALQIIRGGN